MLLPVEELSSSAEIRATGAVGFLPTKLNPLDRGLRVYKTEKYAFLNSKMVVRESREAFL